MADFRRIVLALAVLALFAGLAGAQSMVCNASTVPTQLRSEGITDLMGDIQLQCTGGAVTPAGQNIPQANFVLYTNTAVTSRLLTTSGTTGTASEAMLLIDEPGSGETTNAYNGSQLPLYGATVPIIACPTPLSGCTAIAGTASYSPTGGGGPYPIAIPQTNTATTGPPVYVNYNAYWGIVSGNSVTFNGVPILAPGTTAYSRIYRITNVRVNASAITGGTLPGNIIADVAISGPTSVSVNNSALTTGYVAQSLKTSIRSGTDGSTLSQNLLQCNTSGGLSTSTTTPAVYENLRYTEQFASAFKTRVNPTAVGATGTYPGTSSTAEQNVPGNNYLSESGFTPYVGTTAVNYGGNTTYIPGLADYGTRLAAVFSNIPAGVSIYVPTTTDNGSSTTTIQLIPSATYLYGGSTLIGLPATTTSPVNLVQLPVSSGSATAVWEVMTTSTATVENVDIPVYILYTANPGANTPGIGTMTVNQRYAPVAADIGGTITSASSSQPIPRFIDTSMAGTFGNIVACTTSLLFPYVTEIAGFDTGLAIANTSSDTFSTTPQAGACTLTWFGTAAPSPTVTATVAGGTIWAGLTSILAPGFNGYMIATCNFQFAHGFAFVSDLGARNLAMGYLALVMNQNSGSFRPTPTAESLEN